MGHLATALGEGYPITWSSFGISEEKEQAILQKVCVQEIRQQSLSEIAAIWRAGNGRGEDEGMDDEPCQRLQQGQCMGRRQGQCLRWWQRLCLAFGFVFGSGFGFGLGLGLSVFSTGVFSRP